MLLGMSFLSVSSGAAGQKSRENSLAAIEAGTSIVERPDVLAVATGAMVTGADCATEPCWAAVQADAPLDVEGESEEPRLASTKSNAILKRCSGPVARKGVAGQNHLIADSILFWLWAVDPDAYFFAYVRSGKLQALPTPARPDSPRVPVQDTDWASGSLVDADRLGDRLALTRTL